MIMNTNSNNKNMYMHMNWNIQFMNMHIRMNMHIYSMNENMHMNMHIHIYIYTCMFYRFAHPAGPSVPWFLDSLLLQLMHCLLLPVWLLVIVAWFLVPHYDVQ